LARGQRAGDCDAETRSDQRVTRDHNKAFKAAARSDTWQRFFFSG
jgi:hypothetical protein